MWGGVAGLALAALAAGACGRLGYDPLAHGDGDGGTGDVDADPLAPDADPLAPDADPLAPDAASGEFVISVSIAADVDDGMIRDGVHSMSGDVDHHIHLGQSSGASSWGYFRFTMLADIPAAAVLDEVRLRLPAAIATAWDESAHGLRVFVEDSADAAPITDAREAPDGTTPGFVRYPVPTAIDWGAGGLAWPTGETVTSPDLSVALDELLQNHGGLAAGAHLQLWVRGDGSTADGAVATRDLSGGAGATLTVRWHL
jgi:hypothetical protein